MIFDLRRCPTSHKSERQPEQTHAEKCVALKTLLPLVAEHLHRHRHYRVVPAAKWVSEGGEPVHGPGFVCDERCAKGKECHRKDCPDEAWVRAYRAMRGRYPVMRRIEQLLELQMEYGQPQSTYRAAIFGIYITPWELMDNPHWRELAETGVAWLVDHCTRRDGTPYRHIPVYEGEPPRRRFYTAANQLPRDVEIISRLNDGQTYTSIARALRCSKATIEAVRYGKVVRRGRTRTADS